MDVLGAKWVSYQDYVPLWIGLCSDKGVTVSSD